VASTRKCLSQSNLNAVGTVLIKEAGSRLRTHIYAYATKRFLRF
jgi:hypothetical protein